MALRLLRGGMTEERSESQDGRRDVARAVTELAERLPARLAPLARITYNYAWTWTAGAAALFHDIDPAMWRRSECNPRALVEATPRGRLRALAADDGFVARVDATAAALTRTTAPLAVAHGIPRDRPVAYFCSEIEPVLGHYLDGLGLPRSAFYDLGRVAQGNRDEATKAYDGENGWAIDAADGDPAAQDDRDATLLLDLLERQVIPLFYERDRDGIPHGWLRRIKASLRSLLPSFTAERMLRDYVETMYLPPTR